MRAARASQGDLYQWADVKACGLMAGLAPTRAAQARRSNGAGVWDGRRPYYGRIGPRLARELVSKSAVWVATPIDRVKFDLNRTNYTQRTTSQKSSEDRGTKECHYPVKWT